MFSVVEHKFNDAEHKFKDVECKFNDVEHNFILGEKTFSPKLDNYLI